VAELPLSRKDGEGVGWIEWMPGMLGGWTQVRDLQVMPKQTFREWFEEREKARTGREISASRESESNGH
jgi:L-lactate dehydrogenase complex protein LldF